MNSAPISPQPGLPTQTSTQVSQTNQQVSNGLFSTINNFFKNVKLKAFLIGLLSFILAVVIWQWISSPMVVTVQGVGEVSVPATHAIISLQVSANSESSVSSINAATNKASKIRNLLQNNGVTDDNIVESQVTSYPASLVTAGATGYYSTIEISAKTSYIDTVPTLISNLYGAGASLVNQPVLTIDDEESLAKKATELALKDAREQVKDIGHKHFRLIRKPISFSEQTSETTSTATIRTTTPLQAADQDIPATNNFKITKLVTISYQLW